MNKSFVGIDVSKKLLDVYVNSLQKHCSFENTERGIQELVQLLEEIEVSLIILEATGGYERLASLELASKFPVRVINPRQVRNFAKATGKLAKTDKIDAKVLADFAESIQPDVRPLPDEVSVDLVAHVTRRRQLLEMKKAERNRLSNPIMKSFKADIEENIDRLNQDLKHIDKKLDVLVSKNLAWKEKKELLESVPGVGSIVSTILISQLPELGVLNSKQIAALVGVAPFNSDSGNSRGQRKVFGGRSEVREALYMSALVGIRYNPVLKDFYLRLRENGKKPKVAIVACIRKLVVILNTMMSRNQKWNPELA